MDEKTSLPLSVRGAYIATTAPYLNIWCLQYFPLIQRRQRNRHTGNISEWFQRAYITGGGGGEIGCIYHWGEEIGCIYHWGGRRSGAYITGGRRSGAYITGGRRSGAYITGGKEIGCIYHWGEGDRVLRSTRSPTQARKQRWIYKSYHCIFTV